MDKQDKAMRELAQRMNAEGHEPMGMAEAKRRLERELFAPNMPATRPTISITEFDAIAIGNMLAMLVDQPTDAEILHMFRPKKVRAALNLVRNYTPKGFIK